MKHFIAFATLGITAVGSGMAIAAHFAMPGAAPVQSPPPAQHPAAMRTSASMMPSVGMPDMSRVTASMPDIPTSLPEPDAAVRSAGRAFGKATDTMQYYSDRAFGPTAQKVKRSVDGAQSQVSSIR